MKAEDLTSRQRRIIGHPDWAPDGVAEVGWMSSQWGNWPTSPYATVQSLIRAGLMRYADETRVAFALTEAGVALHKEICEGVLLEIHEENARNGRVIARETARRDDKVRGERVAFVVGDMRDGLLNAGQIQMLRNALAEYDTRVEDPVED